jgi:hypothetical protein
MATRGSARRDPPGSGGETLWDLEADRRLTGRIGEWGLDEATQKAIHAQRETFVAKARLRLSRG